MISKKISEIFLSGRRGVAQFIIRRTGFFRLLFCWISPRFRNWISQKVSEWVFKNLYAEIQPQKISKNEFSRALESSTRFLDKKNMKPGVNLVGFPGAMIGEGEFLRQTAGSLKETGLEFGIFDLYQYQSSSREDTRFSGYIQSHNPYSVNIFHLKPDQLQSAIIKLGKPFIDNHFNIGYWAWELSEFPDVWMDAVNILDEVWCPSRFIQTGVKKKTSKPAIHMPFSLDFTFSSKDFDRKYFGLPEKKLIFLFIFDFKSVFSRKNPLACIRAFKEAFPSKGEPVVMVIKSMEDEKFPQEEKLLKQEIQKDSRVLHIGEAFSPEEILGLMDACDCFISLHRSEGIGLSLAQCMLLGKPVIATNYSGNTDFMNDENSCRVDYELVEVKKGEYPFGKGQVWADPDIEHAAWHMRRMAEDESSRKLIGRNARAFIQTHHHPAVVGKKIRKRLAGLGLA